MYSQMSFIPELQKFLKDNKVIYTVRKYEMSAALVEVTGVGVCKRLPVRTIEYPKDLESYVKYSGFNSVEDWWAKIRSFIPSKKDKMYLYKVEVYD